MKLNMIVTPAIGPDVAGSLADFQTDMLLLGRFQDGGLGPVQMFNDKTNGKLSRLLVQRKFTGRLGNRFTFENQSGPQRYLLVVGLGTVADFSCVSIAKLVGIAMHKAMKKDCTKVSIPFFPNRSGVKLTAQAQFTREAALVKLKEYEDREGEFTIELLCSNSGNAAENLRLGIGMAPTGLVCCKHVDGTKCM
jgi:Cytosol aminopeptidase family, N-terminal domain